MKKEKKVQEKVNDNIDVLDILLDEENDAPVTLYDGNDKPVKFEQVAVIPLDEKLYIILKPMDKMEGVADDEAIVFRAEEQEDGETELVIEDDEATAVAVFDEFYKLLDEEDGE